MRKRFGPFTFFFKFNDGKSIQTGIFFGNGKRAISLIYVRLI